MAYRLRPPVVLPVLQLQEVFGQLNACSADLPRLKQTLQDSEASRTVLETDLERLQERLRTAEASKQDWDRDAWRKVFRGTGWVGLGQGQAPLSWRPSLPDSWAEPPGCSVSKPSGLWRAPMDPNGTLVGSDVPVCVSVYAAGGPGPGGEAGERYAETASGDTALGRMAKPPRYSRPLRCHSVARLSLAKVCSVAWTGPYRPPIPPAPPPLPPTWLASPKLEVPRMSVPTMPTVWLRCVFLSAEVTVCWSMLPWAPVKWIGCGQCGYRSLEAYWSSCGFCKTTTSI